MATTGLGGAGGNCKGSWRGDGGPVVAVGGRQMRVRVGGRGDACAIGVAMLAQRVPEIRRQANARASIHARSARSSAAEL